MLTHISKAPRCRQKGITLVLISLILLFLIGMAAFSIDINHQVLNKTRLQNAVDAAALSAAVVADETGDVDLAETAARTTLSNFASEDGNGELSFSTENTVITFSHDYETFVLAAAFSPPAGSEDIYVRVASSNISLTQYLGQIFGVGKNVSASAVAGRSASITTTCNLTPIAMCGDPLGDEENAWGYQDSNVDIFDPLDNSPDQIHELKVGSHDNSDMGPGNFQLLDFGQVDSDDGSGGNGNGNGNGNGGNGGNGGGGGGASLVRDALAGGFNGCATIGDTVTTKPGNSIGPVAQGLNTRLNDFSGPMSNGGDIVPDKYIKEPDTRAVEGQPYGGDFYYSNYVSELNTCETSGCASSDYMGDDGDSGRRILRIPIVNCTDAGGKTELNVLGFGCFFLLQSVNNSGQSSVFGQFLYDCLINNGSTGTNPGEAGLFKIQLYKDPFGGAS